MCKPLTHAALLAGAFLALSAFSSQKNTATMSQPSEERKAQDALPQSHDPVWKSFAQCKVHYNDKRHHYSITYTPEVKAMEGKPLTISGFMLPLEATEKSNHFLISKRTPTCPFCPPGEPNEIVEVFTKKPITYDEGILVITGTLKFTTNPDLGLFFQLKDADSMENTSFKPKNKMPLV